MSLELLWLARPDLFAYEMSRRPGGPDDIGLPAWNSRPHLAAIAAYLRDTVSGTTRRLLILVPRQTGKTSLIGLWYPAWLHELHARGVIDRCEVMHSTYSDDYGRTWGARCRRVIEQNPDRLASRLIPGSEAAAMWETQAGGVHISRGLSGTGRTARYLIVDDPIKVEDMDSSVARDAAWRWWLETAGPALAPDSAVVVVATRYHEDDFAGRLLSDDREGDPDTWTVLRLPALADNPHDPLGRPLGGPLYRPDVEQTTTQARDFWTQIRGDYGEHVWLGQYQQNPTAPQGTIFVRDAWGRYLPGEIPEEANQLTSVDCAFKSTADSSFVVVQVWAYERGVEPRRWLVDQLRARMDFRQTKLAVRAAAEVWPAAAPRVVEPKANGPAVVNDLKSAVAGLTDTFDATRRGSKEARAWAVSDEQRRCLIPHPGTEQPKTLLRFRSLCEAEGVPVPDGLHADWVSGFVDELAAFPGGRHDDQVDAFTQALLWVREHAVEASMSWPVGRIS